MEDGYKILWTDNALLELQKTYDYLELHWTHKELKNLSTALDKTLKLISKNPKLFQETKGRLIRRAVVKKYNVLYYRENEKNKVIEVLSFFSNRQDPQKLKI